MESMERITVTLTPRELAILDAVARAKSLTRSAALRIIILEFFKAVSGNEPAK